MLRLLPALANDDPEFSLAARMWDADVLLVSGTDAVRMTVADGRMTHVVASRVDAPSQIRISAEPDVWENMLRAVPPPFYQDLFGAAARHGVLLEGQILDLYAYYPAM